MHSKPLIDIRGAHRGADAVARALLSQRHLPPVEVRLVDEQPGRAQQAALRWQAAGYSASGVTGDALATPVSESALVLAATTDDPAAQLELLRNTLPRLTVMGLLIASREAPVGGWVMGIGAVIPSGDAEIRRNACLLMERIVALTKGRRTPSRNVSSPAINSLQTEHVRRVLYDALGQDVHKFVTTRLATGRLLFATAWPRPSVRGLTLVARNGRSRVEMLGATTSITSGEVLAFIEKDRPEWLLFVLRPSGTQIITIELPESPATHKLRESPPVLPSDTGAIFATD